MSYELIFFAQMHVQEKLGRLQTKVGNEYTFFGIDITLWKVLVVLAKIKVASRFETPISFEMNSHQLYTHQCHYTMRE